MLLIQFPTRERPLIFLDVLKKYRDLAKLNVFFHIVIDTDDAIMKYDTIDGILKRYFIDYLITCKKHISKIDAVNDMEPVMNLAWDTLLLASDDMVPEIPGYDVIIHEKIINHFPDSDGVLHFNDGLQGQNLDTLCILGRAYYKRFDYIYYPGYKSLFADNEFTEVAKKLNKIVYDDRVIIRHNHPAANKAVEYDQLYQRNDIFLHDDLTLFQSRKSSNFGL